MYAEDILVLYDIFRKKREGDEYYFL